MKPKTLIFSTFIERAIEHSVESCPYRQGGNEGVFGLGSWKCEKKCPHCIERDMLNHIVKCNFQILDLSLTYRWYDEIESGRKTVEYREINDYWKRRLIGCKACERPNGYCRYCRGFNPVHFDAVRFHRGQGGKQTMMYECARIVVDKGHVRFGAIPDVYMFNIYLGKRLQ